MARNLKVFNTYHDYETADLIKPAVSLVVSDNSVHYDPASPTPPTPTFQGKWLATYSDSSTASAECGHSSGIIIGEITTTNLVDVEIGDCVTSINNAYFSDCSTLTSATIGSGVTSICMWLFRNCTGLTNISIGNNVKEIQSDAFRNCTSLTSIDIPSGVTSILNAAFQGCTSLTSIDIPSGVTSISNYTFNGCSSLTSITIPDSVTTIGNNAFRGCSGLTSITVNAIVPPTLRPNAFYNTNDAPILVPSASLSAYQSASEWSNYADRITAIPNS
jgi:hypothetical protein